MSTYNKVELDGTTLLDLSQDTASSASHIRSGYTAHLNDGTQVTGTYSGSTPTIQSLSVAPSTSQQSFNASGVDGYKPVTVSAVSQTNLTADNIKSGTTVTISNGTSNLWSVTGTYSGGGGSSAVIMEADSTLSSASYSISFTSLLGEPTSFFIISQDDIATGASPYKNAMVVHDGTSFHAQTITNTSNAQVSYSDTGWSKTYSSGTLTVTSTSTQFQAGDYLLVYSYGGTSANVKTTDVQVGSGATSITFTGLEDEPLYWSCIFKSNFSTSSGYQRVVGVGVTSQWDVAGMEMDSSAHSSAQHWTSSYSNGSLTITSQGTNAGGYFHQPGYYQLTYVLGEASPYEKKSVTYSASTSAQTDKIEPSSGYDAMSEVNVSIPAVSQTNLTAGNIKSGTTVTISNGQNNLWSVTGTYSGGGSANIGTSSMTNSSNQNTSISFTSLSGQPKAFFARCTTSLTRSSSNTYYYVADMVYDGTNTKGNVHARSSGQYSNVTSGYSWSYSGTTLTLSSSGARNTSPGSFYNGTYELVYIY